MKSVIDYGNVCAYAENELPRGQRRDIYCAKLYGYLFRNAEALGLVFRCPHCLLRQGRCRCHQLGRSLNGTWRYYNESAYVRQWHLDVASLVKADVNVLPKSRERAEALYFIRHIQSGR